MSQCSGVVFWSVGLSVCCSVSQSFNRCEDCLAGLCVSQSHGLSVHWSMSWLIIWSVDLLVYFWSVIWSVYRQLVSQMVGRSVVVNLDCQTLVCSVCLLMGRSVDWLISGLLA